MNFWSNASEMLWAGSVDMRSTFSRLFDSNTARLQLRGERLNCITQIRDTGTECLVIFYLGQLKHAYELE